MTYEPRTLLVKLDEVVSEVRIALDRIAAALPEQEPLAKKLDLAKSLGAELRQAITTVCQALAIDESAWETRSGLADYLGSLETVQREHEARSVRGEPLRRVADELDAGTVRHRLETKAAALDRLRISAAAEVRAAAESSTPPRLETEGSSADGFVARALDLRDPQASELLDALRPILPRLVTFLEEMEISHWVAAAAAPSKSSPSRPFETTEVETLLELDPPGPSTLPDPTPSSDVSEDDALPVAPSVAEEPAAEAAELLRATNILTALNELEASVEIEPSDRPGSSSPSQESSNTPARGRGVGKSSGIRLRTPVLDHVSTYERYWNSCWVAPNGAVEPVPWADGAFAARLGKAMNTAFLQERFAELWVYSKASEVLQLPTLVASADLESAAALQMTPMSSASGRSEARPGELREGLEQLKADGSLRWKLPLLLEAVRPWLEAPLQRAAVDGLLESITFHDSALSRVLRSLLYLGSSGVDPMPQVRRALGAAPAQSSEQVKAKLAEKRSELHREFTRLLPAVGRTVQRTHCRKAWDEFTEKSLATFKPLFPTANGGASDPSRLLNLQTSVLGLEALHTEIAERRGARFVDRSRMDRGATTLADLANEVLLLATQLAPPQSAKTALGGSDKLLPLDDLQKLTKVTIAYGDDEFCRRLLVRLVAEPTAVRDGPGWLSLRGQVLLDHPHLLTLLHGIPAGELGGDDAASREVARVSDIAYPMRAAAILLTPAVAHSGGANKSLVEALGAHFEASGRVDLQSRLTQGGSTGDQTRMHRLVDKAWQQVEGELAHLRSAWRELDELARPLKDVVRQVTAEAEQLLLRRATDLTSAAPEQAVELDLPLAKAWLGEVHALAKAEIDVAVEVLQQRVEALEPRVRDLARFALRERRWPDALRLAGDPVVSEARQVRQTAWRSTEGTAKLPSQHGSYEDDPELRKLVVRWSEGVDGTPKDRPLRTLFAQYVFGRPFGDGKKLYDRGQNQNPAYFQMSSLDVREWIAYTGLNPSFVPQLASYQYLYVVTTPDYKPTTGRFIDETASAAARYEKSIVIVLAPRITRVTRDQTLKRCHDRGLCVAIVDDQDLCRLVGTGPEARPNAVLGLLEIAFEQQPWSRVSPFELLEGQHVKMEMYVGRRKEAEDIALTDRVSRLFSGRKLGKSALLKFIEETWSGRQLPSGKKLRVFYVPIAGVATDVAAVRDLRMAMKRVGFELDGLAESSPPGDVLPRLFNAYLERRRDESLLIILDEADTFVDAQLEAYDRAREQCLTFIMRTQIRAPVDKQGLPRVRFLFAGYRSTNTSGGTWANWGGIARLDPLTPADASWLVEGPLTRLGIDATAQASAIAYRCGYQPAVLLRFGERLLDWLDQNHPVASRGHVVVTAEDVAAVFQDSKVQEEIRTIVWNNFQGNKIGLIVFRALLLEFVDLAPGDPLDDAEAKVFERLRSIDSDTLWLNTEDASARSAIKNLMDEFVERKLLVSSSDGNAYALRFPHHLPVLLQQGLLQLIRSEIQGIRTAGPRHHEGRAPMLLPPGVLRDVNEALESIDLVRAVVVGSHWRDAVEDPHGGVADRLGFDEASTLKESEPRLETALSAGRVAVAGATPALLARILKDTKSHTPPLLMGGVDLLRAAREKGGSVEVGVVGRLARHQIWWWFERVRCFEFARPNAIELLADRTGGVPLFLRRMDRLLRQRVGTDSGVTISADALAHVLEAFERSMDEDAEMLLRGPEDVRLRARELEVLQLMVELSRSSIARTPDDLRLAATDLWDEHRATLTGPISQAQALGNQDELALRLLLDLGLVPARQDTMIGGAIDRIAPFGAGDPVLELADALVRRSATG